MKTAEELGVARCESRRVKPADLRRGRPAGHRCQFSAGHTGSHLHDKHGWRNEAPSAAAAFIISDPILARQRQLDRALRATIRSEIDERRPRPRRYPTVSSEPVFPDRLTDPLRWASRYGLTPHGLQQILDRQNGTCALCPETADLHIDHDHTCCPPGGSCGRCVRGLLCQDHNLALGLFRDDDDALTKAAAYLGRSSQTRHEKGTPE